MLNKIALLFLLSTVFSSCDDIYYDSETRLVVEGQLVDKNGSPIVSRDVAIVVKRDDDHDGLGATDIIASGYSDRSGNFKFAIPAPENSNNRFDIQINKNEDALAQSKDFIDIERKDFVDYRYNLNSVVLYAPDDICYLLVETSTTDVNHILNPIAIEGLEASRIISVNSYQIDYIQYDFGYHVVKNQTVILHYSVTDYTTQITTEYNIPIQIGSNSTLTYNLTY